MNYEHVFLSRFGESDVLQYGQGELPAPGAGQVLIEVAGAGVNPIDYKTRNGLGFVAEQIRDALPWTPGFDIAGTVIAVGTGVEQWQPGDEVIGMPGFPAGGGGYATHALAGADALVAAPDAIPLSEAAGIPLAALTAWQALFDCGKLEAGQKVLIHAGAGGVGHFAIQFAKSVDAYVIATGSAENHDFLHEIGVDEAIDYRTTDFHEDCYGLDLVIDGVGGQVGMDSLAVLAGSGRLVTIPTVTAGSIRAAADALGVEAVGMTVRFDVQQLEEIVELIDTGEVRVHIGHRYILTEAAAAHQLQESGHSRGKIILTPESKN